MSAVATRQSNTPVLAQLPIPVTFDPENKHHRLFYAMFHDTGRWSPQAPRFQVEWPHTSAVTTINTKLTRFALRRELAKLEAVTATLAASSLS